MPGRWFDPFNQNVLKGDYPIIGQHTFLDITAVANLDFEGRQIPTQTSPFESTERPFSGNFFGRPNSFFTLDFFSLSFDLFHGDAAFKPVDWRIKLVPTLGVSNFSFSELAQTSPNVLQGPREPANSGRFRRRSSRCKLADLSPDYDFVSIRAGNQPFINDFRGFLFADINRGVRLFGTRISNRDQFNLVYFRQWEKDTNSELNTFNDRRPEPDLRQLLPPGLPLSRLHGPGQPELRQRPGVAQVRQEPVPGPSRPGRQLPAARRSTSVYLGWAGDGHWGRYNLTHQFYWAFGRDSLNPLANRPQTINAQMAAIEGSYDRDWVRFRLSFFWASGDGNINNIARDRLRHDPRRARTSPAARSASGTGSRSRSSGVNLVQRLSLVPDLRSSKIQGQANFVNPGLILPTFGMDFDLTPKLQADHQLQPALVRQDQRARSSSSSRGTSTGSSASTWAWASSTGRS